MSTSKKINKNFLLNVNFPKKKEKKIISITTRKEAYFKRSFILTFPIADRITAASL